MFKESKNISVASVGFLSFLLTLGLVLIIGLFILPKSKDFLPKVTSNGIFVGREEELPTPEFSAWISWWEEEKAYDLLQKYPEKIKTVMPVWFMVDKNLDLVTAGKKDKKQIAQNLRSLNIEILATIGSEVTGDDLSPLFNDPEISERIIEKLVTDTLALGADGVDVDLEGIKKEDREKFTEFLDLLARKLRSEGLKISITIHAQTQIPEWDGVLGQDLERIGEIADEVRIMTYDKHSASSEPGAISPFDWISQVALFNERIIDKEKIVMGIPSYGYVWPSDGNPKGLQYYEFNDYLEGKEYKTHRDASSGELVFESEDFSGWLSDSVAMIEKVEKLRALGFRKFTIWHLGGLDEKLFEKDW